MTYEFADIDCRSEADVKLVAIAWSDYGYKTSYLALPTINGQLRSCPEIGSIHIAYFNQDLAPKHKDHLPKGAFTKLPYDFFSWSYDVIGLFKNLNRFLSPEKRQEFLSGLNFMFPDDDIYDRAKNTVVYQCCACRNDFHIKSFSESMKKERAEVIQKLITDPIGSVNRLDLSKYDPNNIKSLEDIHDYFGR